MEEVDRLVLKAQKNEITEYQIYSKLSEKINGRNKKILCEIAKDELKHYDKWKKISKRDVKPNLLRVYWYVFISSILGITFGLKLMERCERFAKEAHKKSDLNKKLTNYLAKEEYKHEKKLLNLIREERVEYAGSIVLGLNDALVELTGALSGLTFALQNGKIIAITGFIMGVAASMSMAASGYLSSREDGNREKNPRKSAIYTGVAYIVTVLFLISPYLLLDNVYLSLGVMLFVAILIIAFYTFYISTAKELKFGRRFLEMAIISLSVAIISFLIGLVIRKVFMVEI